MTKKEIKRSPIQEWELDRIIPYENNAKLHPDFHIQQIANSINEFTFLDPVAVDEMGCLLEGHGRLLAAKQRGDATIPVIQVTGLSEAQKVAYRLTHNKLTVNTGFDSELLKIDFDLLKDFDFNLDLTGFTAEELDLKDDRPFGESGNGSDGEWKKPESRCSKGQIWQLGRHKLACGDATDEQIIDTLLSSVPDLIWSDPPYGMKCQRNDGTIGGVIKNIERNNIQLLPEMKL